MVASAAIFLRRVAIPATSKATRQQMRSASTLGLCSTLTPISPLRSTSVAGVATTTSSCRGMATMSAGDALARLASDHPHQEIIRYEHKNVKWTLKHVNYYSDALACGLVDAGLQPGDVVLSWLPLHIAEQVSVCLSIENHETRASEGIFSIMTISHSYLFDTNPSHSFSDYSAHPSIRMLQSWVHPIPPRS